MIFCCIGITMDRAVLYKRIEDRVDKMLKQGLVEEARFIFEKLSRAAYGTESHRLQRTNPLL